MKAQFHLFEKAEQRWPERIWQTVEAKTRDEIVGLLAEMGKRAIEAERELEEEGRTNDP